MAQLMKQQRINDGHDPDRAATTIKNKLKGRSATQTENMRGFQPVHLSNTNKQAVTLKANAEGARLYINGINVPYADFNGHLFAPEPCAPRPLPATASQDGRKATPS